MKFSKIVKLILFLILIASIMTGCGEKDANLSEEAKKVVGKWAYIHDRETTIIELKKDGTAKYEKETYSFDADGTYITLTNDKNETLKFRYVIESDGMLFYKTTEYTFEGEGEPKGIVGYWANPNKWSFEFSSQGTFMEDGYFPGMYTVDEANSSVKLIYTDHFEDTIVYYKVDGEHLSLEYPWKMVKTGTK